MAAIDAQPGAGYACEPAVLALDRADILSIWASGLANAGRQAAKFDWFYLGSEAGEPLVALLRHGGTGRRVGVAAAGPRRIEWAGRETLAGVLVDLSVVPEHRSLFPALMLQRALQAAVPAKLAMLYGFPNPRAVPVFSRVGYRKSLDVGRRVRVLRTGRYLRRKLPGVVASVLARVLDAALAVRDEARWPSSRKIRAFWSDAPDARVDALWAESPRGRGPVGVRDARFLRWRFEGMPGGAFLYLNLESPDGRLLAWFVGEPEGDFLTIRDFWTRRGDDAIDAPVIATLLRQARGAGYAAVCVEFGGSARIVHAFEAFGFSERSRRPFFTYFGNAAGTEPAASSYVTSADEDE